MSPRPLSLLLFVFWGTAISGNQPDTTGSIRFSASCDQRAAGGPLLRLRCVFERAKTEENIVSIRKMTIARSAVGGGPRVDFETVATLTGPSQAAAWIALAGVDVSSEFDANALSVLDVVYESQNQGYNRAYACFVDGSTPQGSVIYERDIEVGGPENTSMCTYDNEQTPTKNGTSQTQNEESQTQNGESQVQNEESQTKKLTKRVEQCCVSSETVRNNSALLEDLTVKVVGLCALKGDLDHSYDKVQTLNTKVDDLFKDDLTPLGDDLNASLRAVTKVLLINTLKYDMSIMYNKTTVYIASKDKHTFNLEEMNNLCKKLNGYLVELDDQEEHTFLTDFLATMAPLHLFATGGHFERNGRGYVYYNSKKPIPEDLWRENEPVIRPWKDVCVQVASEGLYTTVCDRQRRHVCEIPLFTPFVYDALGYQ